MQMEQIFLFFSFGKSERSTRSRYHTAHNIRILNNYMHQWKYQHSPIIMSKKYSKSCYSLGFIDIFFLSKLNINILKLSQDKLLFQFEILNLIIICAKFTIFVNTNRNTLP